MRARRVRVLRGLIAAATATFVAALSHTVSGDAAPGLFALAAASVLAVFVCILFAGRSLSAWRLGVSVALSQLGYHLLFALAPATSGTVTTGGHHSGMVLLTTDAVTHVHASAGPVMWFGHAIAAGVTIAALLSGERVLVALFDTLWIGIRALLVGRAPSVIGRPLLTAVDSLPVLVARQRLLLSAMRHRGPPAAARRNTLAFA
ncbi:hypothetical protein [Mycetocola zhujimingii]|uniref:Uncharacterized protein n=1 Tax=Mycetocola zhujimingii TaxID=2079792 RepID=A0A2U1TFT3_9MICO|nr:hypothetical protein [Mycetocola zhujimingii]PWC07726.1 hypothetical protein DF223_04520 [Mycetocola zhujimingii]